MIITSDLHLSDRSKDKYRWRFLKWLKKQMDSLKETELVVCGDITDAKDKHSAKLVNKIIDTFSAFPGDVFLMKGNHDYLDEDCPFLRFLRGALGDKIRFLSEPQFIGTTLFLPHSRNPITQWNAIKPNKAMMIICHQTFNQAVAEKGHELSSFLLPSYWSARGFEGLVVSGDIHVPQQLGDVTYCGAPYPVKFGDSYEPRILRYDGDKLKSIKVPSIKRLSLDLADVEELAEEKLSKGDQLKVRVHLPRSEFGSWAKHKARLLEIAAAAEAEVFSVELRERMTYSRKKKMNLKAKAPVTASPRAILKQFCEARGLHDSLQDVGKDLVKELR